MTTTLLDTSVYCQPLKQRPLVATMRKWEVLGNEALAISSVCEAELLYGLAKKNSPSLFEEYHAVLEDRLLLIPFDKECARSFADIKAAMEKQREPLSDADLMIAATAITNRLTLVTLNLRNFEKIPGLHVEDWSQ